jgi:hypothetical protein
MRWCVIRRGEASAIQLTVVAESALVFHESGGWVRVSEWRDDDHRDFDLADYVDADPIRDADAEPETGTEPSEPAPAPEAVPDSPHDDSQDTTKRTPRKSARTAAATDPDKER